MLQLAQQPDLVISKLLIAQTVIHTQLIVQATAHGQTATTLAQEADGHKTLINSETHGQLKHETAVETLQIVSPLDMVHLEQLLATNVNIY